MMSTTSRVRASGLPNGWPYQPSTTCGPLTPMPRMTRPFERWSSVSTCIAIDVGVRPGHLHDRRAELDPRGLAAPPGQRGERVAPPRLGGEDRVEPGVLGRGDQLADALRGLCAPVAELQSELHGLSCRGTVPSGACPILERVLLSDHDTNTVSTGHRSVRLHPLHRTGHRTLPHRPARRRGRRRPYVGRRGRRPAAGVRPGTHEATDRLRRGRVRRDRHVLVLGARAGEGPAVRPAVRLRAGDPRRRDPADLPRARRRSPDEVSTGMRVQVRWAEERVGAITDIECFEPADRGDGGDAPERRARLRHPPTSR